MRKFILLAAAALPLAACTGAQVTADLEALGVSVATSQKVGQIDAAVLAQGTLFCSLDGVIAAVPSVSVVNASAASVANACKVATAVSGAVAQVAIPVAPPAAGTPVQVASVPPAAVAAVAASVPAAQ